MKLISKSMAIFLLLFILTGCRDHHLSGFPSGSVNSSENVLIPTQFVYEDGSETMPNQFRYALVEMDDYVYYDDGTSLVRLNTSTGERSYLCADPLCSHRSGCEYQRSYMRSFYAEDGKLFFWRNYDSGEIVLVMYDTKSAKQSVLCPLDGNGTQVPVFTYHSPYIYYYVVVSEETDEYQVGDVLMHQIDTRSMEDVIVCTFADGKYGYCAGVYQDSLIIMTSQTIQLYAEGHPESVLIDSDDIHGTSIYSNSYCLQENYLRFFSTDRSVSDAPKTYFWEYDLEQDLLKEVDCIDGEITNSSYCYTQNACYYRIKKTYSLGTFIAENNANSGEVELSHPGIYKLNYDTGSVEPILLELPDEYKTCNLSNEFLVVGNYIYVSYNHFGSVSTDGVYYEKDFSQSLSGLMRIDIRDGSLVYVGGK